MFHREDLKKIIMMTCALGCALPAFAGKNKEECSVTPSEADKLSVALAIPAVLEIAAGGKAISRDAQNIHPGETAIQKRFAKTDHLRSRAQFKLTQMMESFKSFGLSADELQALEKYQNDILRPGATAQEKLTTDQLFRSSQIEMERLHAGKVRKGITFGLDEWKVAVKDLADHEKAVRLLNLERATERAAASPSSTKALAKLGFRSLTVGTSGLVLIDLCQRAYRLVKQDGDVQVISEQAAEALQKAKSGEH